MCTDRLNSGLATQNAYAKSSFSFARLAKRAVNDCKILSRLSNAVHRRIPELQFDPSAGKYELVLVNSMSGWALPSALRKVSPSALKRQLFPPSAVSQQASQAAAGGTSSRAGAAASNRNFFQSEAAVAELDFSSGQNKQAGSGDPG